MQIQPPFAPQPAALPQAAEPAATPGSPGGGFAQLMANTRNERESARPRETEADKESADPEDGSDTAAPPASGRPDESRAARLRNTARPARAPQAQARPAAKPAESTDEAARRADTPAADKDGAAMDPTLAQWLAQLHLPPADAAVPKLAASGGGASPDGEAAIAVAGAGAAAVAAGSTAAPAAGLEVDSAAADPARTGANPGERAGAGLAERAGREPPAISREAATRAAEESTAAAASAEREPAMPPAPQGFALPAGFDPAQAAVALRAESAPAASVDAPANVAVPVPFDSADFAHTFGVQVSVLARDGVHEARLHLNPAEMGPVSVQIAMDGERARIDFGAQAAATRAAIEASLPELAAALRDAGLTLSGGGVSQHTPGRGDAERGASPDAAPTATRERAVAASGTTSRPAWRGRVSPGGVDLYA